MPTWLHWEPVREAGPSALSSSREFIACVPFSEAVILCVQVRDVRSMVLSALWGVCRLRRHFGRAAAFSGNPVSPRFDLDGILVLGRYAERVPRP